MRPIGAQLRPLLAVLMAVVLPLCCCDVRLVLGSDMSAGGAVAAGARRAGGCCSHRAAAPPEKLPAKKPLQDGEGTCLCAKHKIAVGAERVELPRPDLVAVLPLDSGIVHERIGAGVGFAMCGAGWMRFKPPTSLLSQHCALTI